MSHEAAYWLSLIQKSGLKLSRLKPIIQQWHLMEGHTIVDLFNLSALELSARFELSDGEAEALLKAADFHAVALKQVETWQQAGIELLTLSHPHYPQRLAYALSPQQQPLLLWARGQTEKLTEPCVTVLGKAEPAPDIVSEIEDLAGLLVSEGIGVVSGYGKGLDRMAFETMLALEGGFGVAVLPMGLDAFARLAPQLNGPVDTGQAVLLSPFAPSTPFKETYAEARNLLVDSLALAVVAPEVDSLTLSRAAAALERGLSVLVRMTDSPENRDLISQGAFLMTDPGEVIEMVQQAIIDNSLQVEAAHRPAEQHPPAVTQTLLAEDDDYALHGEDVDPIAPDEALDILSSMGRVPDSLRARLMSLEQNANDQD